MIEKFSLNDIISLFSDGKLIIIFKTIPSPYSTINVVNGSFYKYLIEK